MYNFWIRLLFLVLFIGSILPSNAQMLLSKLNSPYTRLGFGEIQSTDFGVNRAMGGVSAAFSSSENLNYSNPASYSQIRYTTLEGGLFGISKTLNTDSTKLRSNGGSMAYFSIGFPVSKRWGMSFGVMPYSSVSYQISEEKIDPQLSNISYLYEGSGNLNQIYFGNGISLISIDRVVPKRIERKVLIESDSVTKSYSTEYDSINVKKWRNLSVGGNVGYLFGTFNYFKSISYLDQVNTYDLRSTESISANDFIWNVGLQYETLISEKKKEEKEEDLIIGFGVRSSFASSINMSRSILWERGEAGLNTFSVKDTIMTESSEGKNVELPFRIGGGIMLTRSNSWLIGVDFDYGEWSKFSSFGKSNSLANKWRVGAGGEMTGIDDGPLWKRLKYRLGGYYGAGYLQYNNESLEEFGITFGLSFPLRKKLVNEFGKYEVKTFFPLHLSFEIGQFGTIGNELIKEKYFKTTLGFTLNEKWFVKRKYD